MTMFQKIAQASPAESMSKKRLVRIVVPACALLMLTACDSGRSIGQTAADVGSNLRTTRIGKHVRFDNIRKRTTHGYVFSQDTVQQVPIGASRDQVEFVLGTPSTTATFGNKVYYYISQTTETLPASKPVIVDQRVMAVYFDADERVERLADYGIQDGALFDFVSRTTPTTGDENSFLKQIMGNALGPKE